MSAYVLASYDVVDPEGYEPYVPAVIPLLMKHGAEVLVADYESVALEGAATSVNVVLRFPSEEAALAWYNDPDYESVKAIRLNASANGRACLVKEFVMPSEL
jgi:uncharacterized protein (DUF1330 family)